jgi:hypothetical protein
MSAESGQPKSPAASTAEVATDAGRPWRSWIDDLRIRVDTRTRRPPVGPAGPAGPAEPAEPAKPADPDTTVPPEQGR